ncbi:MAG: MBL fold metallo-hydrolase [Saprospiraceae bacterium]|nr:MBL fold metallo-hydrolase [Saprospiraceae bacterium]
MQLSVLTENTANGRFVAEHGLSYLIQQDETTLLFDSGYSDVFLKNAKALNIDLSEVEIVVLSHGHWDHGNGLKHLKNKKLICHPYAFIKRYRKLDNTFVGLDCDFFNLQKKFKIVNTTKPYKISESIFFLGEIPRINSFESKTTSFVDAHGTDDFIPDDSALAVISNDELIVVSGCDHSGICNIVEYAKKISGINKIRAVMGGFHLSENNSQTQKTIDYFKTQNIESIMPSHCTGLPVLARFHNEFETMQLKSGMILKF